MSKSKRPTLCPSCRFWLYRPGHIITRATCLLPDPKHVAKVCCLYQEAEKPAVREVEP